MGTDGGVGPHGTNLEELELMVEAGMTPLETLHATTGSAAALLDVAEDRGTLRPGLRADLVVVDGSPEDVTGMAAGSGASTSTGQGGSGRVNGRAPEGERYPRWHAW